MHDSQSVSRSKSINKTIFLLIVFCVITVGALIITAYTFAKEIIIPIIAPIVSVFALVILPLRLRDIDMKRSDDVRNLDNEKSQKSYAMELYRDFRMSEFYVKARLISQEYLLPPGEKYTLYQDKDFIEIDTMLSNSNTQNEDERKQKQEARTCIRAITSFFWAVDQAREKGLIKQDENMFSEIYAWYWVHIISMHVKPQMASYTDQFATFTWMSSEKEILHQLELQYRRYLASDITPEIVESHRSVSLCLDPNTLLEKGELRKVLERVTGEITHNGSRLNGSQKDTIIQNTLENIKFISTNNVKQEKKPFTKRNSNDGESNSTWQF
jgi:hypothetical protein